jgi:hypothetical protein
VRKREAALKVYSGLENRWEPVNHFPYCDETIDDVKEVVELEVNVSSEIALGFADHHVRKATSKYPPSTFRTMKKYLRSQECSYPMHSW